MSSPTKLKVQLIGSNPSIKSQSDFAFFLDTRSGRALQEWIKDIDADFIYSNVSDMKTENNRPLTRAEVRSSIDGLIENLQSNNPDRIVALGNTASLALKLVREKIGYSFEFLEIPHPSGLNRKLNDKNYKEQKIKELAAFCAASSVYPK